MVRDWGWRMTDTDRTEKIARDALEEAREFSRDLWRCGTLQERVHYSLVAIIDKIERTILASVPDQGEAVPAAWRYLYKGDIKWTLGFSAPSDAFKAEPLYPAAPHVQTPAQVSWKRDWVNCPICGESDMRCETFDEGATLIHCTNHQCASNKPSAQGDSGTKSGEKHDRS